MPLNPNRPFNTIVEGELALNADGLWAIAEDGEELTYWDEGQAIELARGEGWCKGTIAWDGMGYGVALPDGTLVVPQPGDRARRRVGGSI